VAQLEACLVDAYDTIVTCDFSPLRGELPAIAGLTADAWQQQYERFGPMLTDGRVSKAEAFGEIVRACGREPRPDLIREMVRADQELLLANARLYDDVLPFLTGLRARGVKIAVVSNCTENTRPLLTSLGVAALADALVLSYEVGAAKPAAEIFKHALDRLAVTADAALFVDDQPGFCAGSVAVGIVTVQIVRGEQGGTRPAAEEPAGITSTARPAVVRSLPEVEAMFWGRENG
jgi:putative hydrolase of the HAD superfamily